MKIILIPFLFAIILTAKFDYNNQQSWGGFCNKKTSVSQSPINFNTKSPILPIDNKFIVQFNDITVNTNPDTDKLQNAFTASTISFV